MTRRRDVAILGGLITVVAALWSLVAFVLMETFRW